MSASILDSAATPHERPRDFGPGTTDLSTTTDLHDENTADLAPATEDIEPRDPAVPEKRGLARGLAALSISLPMVRPASTPAVAPPPEKERVIAPGTVLGDRYLLEKVIGRGGTSIVFRARDMQSSTSAAPNLPVAIKTPRADLTDSARSAQRLEHEFRHAQQLSHPGIVRTLDLHAQPGRCYMTMELIDGTLLSELLRERRPIPAPTALKILRSCADALSHAHGRNVVHGDFKPGNVFVLPDHSVKVFDFGAATATPETDAGSRVAAATAAYASPQVLGCQVPELRDDVFSFACVAYEVLAGQHPFEGMSSLEARDESRIPPRAWSLTASQWLALLAALSWEREQRPTDLDSLVASLTPETPPAAEPRVAVAIPAERRELRADLMPRQRSWGFFVFVACALAVTYIASQRNADSPTQIPTPTLVQGTDAVEAAQPKSTARSLASIPTSLGNSGPSIFETAPERTPPQSTSSGASARVDAPSPATPPAPAPKAAPLGEISFESKSIVTSESSVAAVFIVKRSQPLQGRVRVQWSAISGTADAGIDFASSTSGRVEFADGQAQRAIYVPLRNDLLKEDDETFTVRLQSPKQARIGANSRSEATIRDDD